MGRPTSQPQELAKKKGIALDRHKVKDMNNVQHSDLKIPGKMNTSGQV